MSDPDSLVVHCYYAVFVVLAVFLNGLLIYLINFKSPHTHSSFKLLLMNTSVSQILLAIFTGFVQQRILLSSSATALIPLGPCRPFGVMSCFVAYNIIHALNLNVQMSTLLSMFFRYRLVGAYEMTTAQLRASYVISVTLPITYIIASHIGPLHFDRVMEETIHYHSEHNFAEIEDFGGYESTSDIIASIYAFISFVTATATPILIWYWRSVILKRLRLNKDTYSEKTRHSSKVFLKALTSQAVIQLLCYLPISALYFGAKYSGTDLAITEYVFVPIMTAHCMIDPICLIYLIPPYKKWISDRLCGHILPTHLSAVKPRNDHNISTANVFVTPQKSEK